MNDIRTTKCHIKKAAFLAAFAECGNISRASELAEVNRHQHSRWMKADQGYCDGFGRAVDKAVDTLAEEARRRAVDGLRRVKFYQGKPIIDPETGKPYFEHEYSDVLLMFMLKAMRPETFRDNVHISRDPSREAMIVLDTAPGGGFNERRFAELFPKVGAEASDLGSQSICENSEPTDTKLLNDCD
jgi:hypothetical protein